MEAITNKVPKNKAAARSVQDIIESAAALLMSDAGSTERAQGLKLVQTQLRTQTGPAAEQLLNMGLIDVIVSMLVQTDTHISEVPIIVEIISNIASCKAEITEHLVNLDVLPILMGLLSGQTELKTLESAVWALGNIAGDSVALRNEVIGAGALDPIMNIMVRYSSATTLVKICIWCISNLPRGGRFPDELLRAAPIACALLQHPEKEIKCDALWTLSFLSDGPNHRQARLVEIPGLVEKLIPLLGVDLELQVPALRTVGNLLSGDNSTAQVLIDAGAIEAIIPLLGASRNGVRKEACWSLSNIFGGTAAQIKRCLDAGTIPPLVRLVASRPADVAKEAAWCIVNALTGCELADVGIIVQVAPNFCATSMLKICNWASGNLRGIDDTNPYTEFFRQTVGSVIETLSTHCEDAEILKLSYFSSHVPTIVSATSELGI